MIKLKKPPSFIG